MINKIHDAQLANNFYPELYLKSSIPEASLITVDHAANDKNSYSGFDLIDMEASAIFAAALIFVPLDHLHFLKIVSDNCSDKFLDKHQAKDLFAKNKDLILEYFNNLKIHQALQPKLLSWEEFQKIKLLAENAYLSHTQFAQLEQALEHFLYKRGELNTFFKLFNKTIANKNEGKAYLNDLINFCKSEDV